jgi:hypothetical protein
MHAFDPKRPLSDHLTRWQPTVDAMLDGVRAPGVVYLMVDQAAVRAGSAHRRPGVHVDMYWHAGASCHGGGGGHGAWPPSHRSTPSTHRPRPVGRHIWEQPWARPGGRHGNHGRHGGHGAGAHAEALIVAADVLGCAAYVGSYDAQPGGGGDCAHIDVSSLDRVELAPGYAWAGHTMHMLHESLPVSRDCLRTLVRLNVPGWAP